MLEYTEKHKEAVKDLFVELQEYLAGLDERKVLILKDNYRDEYFDYVISELEKHEGKIFLAEAEKGIVGVVVCKIFQGGGESELTTSCPKIGFISDLVVTKAERGHGIGKGLIAAAENYFTKNGCEYTQLEVFAPNASAFELYKKLGFRVNCYYMSKNTKEA